MASKQLLSLRSELLYATAKLLFNEEFLVKCGERTLKATLRSRGLFVMQITRRSTFTGIERTLDLPITEEQWALWMSNNPPPIQFCFPNLTDDQREFILTGATAEEWDVFMKSEEENGWIFDSSDEEPF